jgi:hypothetical protein
MLALLAAFCEAKEFTGPLAGLGDDQLIFGNI